MSQAEVPLEQIHVFYGKWVCSILYINKVPLDDLNVFERVIGRGVCCPVFNVFGSLVFLLLVLLIYSGTPLT